MYTTLWEIYIDQYAEKKKKRRENLMYLSLYELVYYFEHMLYFLFALEDLVIET